MKKKYKIALLISNLFLLIFVFNLFAKIIVFPNPYINGFLIFLGCIFNVVIALKASYDVVNNK